MEYLASEVLTKDGIVTYNTLARSQSLLITKAKQILYDFYTANKSDLHASFIVIGQPKTSSSSTKSTSITKCDSTTVDAVVREFEHVEAVHVYYVSRHAIENLQLALVEAAQPLERSEMDKLGIIRNSAKLTPVKVTKNVLNISSRSSINSISNTAIHKAAVSEPKKEKPKSGLSSLSSHYVSRKASASTANASASNAKKRPMAALTGLKYQSRKLQNTEPKERVIVADQVDEDIEMAEVESRSHKTNAAQSASMKGLFADLSDFDDTEETVEVAEPIVVEEETKLEYPTEEPIPVSSEPAAPGGDSDKTIESHKDAPVEYETVTIVNDEGFYETIKRPIKSSSTAQSLAPPTDTAPSHTRARSPSSAPSKRKKGQATLMSFFKAKQK